MEKPWLERYADLDERFWKAVGAIAWPRMGLWFWLSVALIIAIAFLASHMLKVLLWKVALATTMAFLGDKIVRLMERRNARPHELLEEARLVESGEKPAPDMWFTMPYVTDLRRRADAIYYRRAIVMGAAMLAGALGT